MGDEQWSRQAEATIAGVELMGDLQPLIDTLDGMVSRIRSRGFTDEQARAVVAYVFGWRPADGSRPEGA